MKRGPRLVARLAAALAFLAIPATANAATIAVTTTSDDFGSDSSSCSLREAVQSSNTDSAFGGCTSGTNVPEDTILLTSGQTYDLTIPDVSNDNTNASGDLDLLGSENVRVTTTGAAQATIDANGDGLGGDPATTNDRALHMVNAGAVTLDNLRITDGSTTSATGSGGAIWLQVGGVLTISNSTVNANHTTEVAGAMRLDASTNIIDSDIHSNTGGIGGAIWIEVGTLDVSGSTITGNSANGTTLATTGVGGAMFVSSSTGSATLRNTTVLGNTANADGGAIYGLGAVTLANATVDGNTADADLGGPFPGNGGGVVGSNVTARNSIVAKNIDASTTGIVDREDCDGTVNSEGYNLIETTTGCTITGTTTGNITGTDPMLDVFDAHGGPLESQPLLPGSPAINAGNPAAPGSGAPACEAGDQRGFARGGLALRCDMGAFEVQPPVLDPIGSKSVQAGQSLTFTVSATDPDPFNTLVFSATNLPAGAIFTPATRTFSWIPSASQAGTFPNVQFAVSNGTLSDSEAMAISVSPAPTPAASAPPITSKGRKKKCKKKKHGAAAAKKCKKRK